MWYPSLSELLASKIISGSVDDYMFAASGYGLRPGKEDFKTLLRRYSLFRAVEAVAPEIFVSMAGKFQQEYVAGMSEGKIFDDIRAQTGPLVIAHMAIADNAVALDFAALLADEYEALGKKDVRACYKYATGLGTTKIASMLPANLISREGDVAARLLRSAPVTDVIPQNQIEQIYRVIFERLAQQYGAEAVQLLASPDKLPTSQYARYCQMAVALFRQIAQLPPLEAGYVMRGIYKDQVARSQK
jgi:hypothetical protein